MSLRRYSCRVVPPSLPRGGETFLMLRNKEPELAENIDSSFGGFELGFYRFRFVFWLLPPLFHFVRF